MTVPIDKFVGTFFKYPLKKYLIFCDLDGVLTDFDLSFQNLTKGKFKTANEYTNHYSKDDTIDLIEAAGESFWFEMKWKKDGVLLWNYIKKYNPIILTSYPDRESCYNPAYYGKTAWVLTNLGRSTQIVVTREKEHYANDSSVLIDDHKNVIKKYTEAGGLGIVHTSSLETINILKLEYGL